MSIEALKEQARRHEQKEQWDKALELYVQAIERVSPDDPPDIGLFNRAGDLATRVGRSAQAVTFYEKAVDLYVEAELPNNAIAICKKVIRNLPDRHSVHLKIGQIRAAQGFITDARSNFITYAERVQASGDVDEAFRALIEFVELAPQDYEIRLVMSAQLELHERKEEALVQLVSAHRVLINKGMAELAQEVEERISRLDPDGSLQAGATSGTLASPGEGGKDDALADAPSPGDNGPTLETDFGSFDIGDDSGHAGSTRVGDGGLPPLPTLDFGPDDEPESEPISQGEEKAEEPKEEEAAEISMGSAVADGGMVDLPLLSFDDEPEDVEEAEEQPALDAAAFGEADDGGRGAKEYVEDEEELPELDVGLADIDVSEVQDEVAADEPIEVASEETEDVAVEEAVEGAIEEAASEAGTEAVAGDHAELAAAGAGDLAGAVQALSAIIEQDPDELENHQRMVEYAFRLSDPPTLAAAYIGLAECLHRSGKETRARAVFQQALSTDPDNERAKDALGLLEAGKAPDSEVAKEVVSTESYVDLGAMLLGEDTEKSTRFVVAYEEPTGDETADFQKMLAQFREKVSENIDADDVTAHYDLGTAYKEMGLLDEAIAQFQQALRASADHLPTYEMLGQTFMEKGENEAALRSLTRALDAPYEVEDELMGIYYYLGVAHEAVGNKESALEFYDRVFSLDINFADVTDRLRGLRE